MKTEDFIEKAKQVHNDKYDYSKTEYVNCHTKVCIICPEHGEFWQLPNVHLRGSGCMKCGLEKIREKNRSKHTFEEFIQKANKIHNNKYDYSKAEYVDTKTKICIICPEHGEFWQAPYAHLKGNKCPECFIDSKKSNKEEFIKKAREIHGDKYDYSKVEYVNSHTKVCIICPEHGEFWQTPNNHSKYGCPECKKDVLSKLRTKTLTEFVTEANNVHNDKYSYENAEYCGTEHPIKINCPIHGEFIQRPQDHLRGHGCPKCANQMSVAEDEICSYLSNIVGSKNIVRRNNNILDNKMEIDIFIPSLNVGIEYNGLRWHSEEFGKDKFYHLWKTDNAAKKGILLLQIFEDEWEENKELVINKIDHILKLQKNMPKIMARKCTIKNIDKDTAEIFFKKNHIQGFTPSTIYIGAFLEEKLIGAISFTEEKKNEWNLTRMATDIDYVCNGVCGKLFNFFKKNYEWKKIKTFADRRWTNNMMDNIYIKLGFKLDKILEPDYRYVFNKKRIHKFNFRKKILSKKYNFPLTMTEKEMANKIKAYRIWDCGLFKYTLTNDNN